MATLLEALIAAIKVLDESDPPVPTGPLAGRVFRTGYVPDLDTVTAPYVTVDYPVTFTPALRGDKRTMAWAPDAAVDVWQRIEDEDDSIWETLVDLLDGHRLPDYAGKCHGVAVLDAGRLLEEPEDGWVRDTILLRIPHVRPAEE